MKEKVDPNEIARSVLRSVANDNLQWYIQADTKAEILIRANALIISVLVEIIIEPTEFHRWAIILFASQLCFSIVVIILSLRSTQPGVVRPRPSGEQRVALLHFLAYEQVEKDEYTTGVKAMFEDADRLYSSLLQDIYYQSQVLARKYRYLHIAFIVFITGLGINALAAIGIAL